MGVGEKKRETDKCVGEGLSKAKQERTCSSDDSTLCVCVCVFFVYSRDMFV